MNGVWTGNTFLVVFLSYKLTTIVIMVSYVLTIHMCLYPPSNYWVYYLFTYTYLHNNHFHALPIL